MLTRSTLRTIVSRLALSLPALMAGVGMHAHAQSTIYKCIDENGRIEFTDMNKRGCKPLDLPGTIAAPRGPATPRATPAAPLNFPKVNTAQQRERDNDRRDILEDELRNEEKKLAELRREFNNGEPERHGDEKNYAKYLERLKQMRESLNRAEQNVAALKREISNIK